MAHIRTRETYGTRRLQTELAENGIIVGRDRLARLRKELRLRCKQKRKFRATTNSNHNLPVAPNLLNQTFTPTAPNQVWVADLTYVATQEGWLWICPYISRHLLSLNPLQARCRRYSRGER